VADLNLQPPPLRAGLVKRDRLIQGLQAANKARIVTVLAPPGYGKTVLMAQWAESEARPTSWLSLDESDNDPGALILHLVESLVEAGMITASHASKTRLSATPTSSAVAGRLVRGLREKSEGGILLLDNIDVIRSRASWDILEGLVHQLEGRIQLAMASRAGVKLPVGALRSQGDLFELTVSELALDAIEARQLLDAMGVDASDEVDSLIEHSEGWPMGLYLAGLAIRVGAPRAKALSLGGDDLYISDYLRNEILDRLSKSRVSFLIRTSILDVLSGPLCDAVLERSRSGRLLETFEESNVFISRVDRTREWHRYHPMFQDLLQAELQLREPELMVDLHTRAAEWFEDNNMLESAIHHAQAAGDPETVARIIVLIGRTIYSTGRSDTLFDWLDWLERQEGHDRYPGAFAIGALAALLTGDVLRTERWTASSGTSDPLTQLVGALETRFGVATMIEDARRARDGLAPGSPWMPATYAVEGLGWLWQGEVEKADSLFDQAISMGDPALATATATIALAERALIAAADGDWPAAEAHCQRSLELVEDHGLGGYTSSAITFAVAARLARKRDDIAEARVLLAKAAGLRPRLNRTFPGISVQTHIELARAYLDMSDVAGARTVLRDARAIVYGGVDLGVLPAELEEIGQGISQMAPARVGPSTLSTAELRLLPLLATHLTFPEIGERLYISRHTVKAQARSIYRKLGASKRSEAVQSATELGFLEG
jgi:LuxR family transcriptional regulator, maltose regulon positive regulatory protein